MPLTDDNAASDPSTDANLDDDFTQGVENGVEGGDNGAESSDAHDVAEGESGTAGIVRDVVEARKPEGEGSSPEGQKDGEGAAKPGSQEKKPDDEGYTDVPFHKHLRFQQLLKQRDGFKQDAERYRNVQTFLNEHNVSPQEGATALEVAALSKTEPRKAWEILKPFVQDLLVRSGEVLPAELKQRVDSGELTVEAATEIAKARAEAASVTTRQELAERRAEQQRTQGAQQAVVDAATTWEQDRAAKDPNFEAKKPALMKELAWLHRNEGPATTPDAVRDQLERAYKAVPAPVAARRQAPQPPPVGQPRPQSRASAPQQQAREPSTLDIIRGVVARRGTAQ